uniref:Protein TIC 21, chloroplastic n=1 Tax=Anthurium amnicola TaxID=1678845 RepID=A0A1D1XVC2_9ARAE
MQATALLLPLGRPHGLLPSPLPSRPLPLRSTAGGGGAARLLPLSGRGWPPCGPSLPLPRFAPSSPSCLFSRFLPLLLEAKRGATTVGASAPGAAFPSPDEEVEKAKLAQVSKRLEKTSRYFKRLGSLGFWGQLVCTVVAAVILSFSAVVTGKVTSPATFYATSAGITAAFVSVFWSFGYIRLSERLRKTAGEPSKAPPRAEVVKSLRNGIVVNLLGMGAAVLGMQATVGLLVAKALTTSAVPYYQGVAAGRSPVLALDVFLVQCTRSLL